jgi:hypothetical protein
MDEIQGLKGITAARKRLQYLRSEKCFISKRLEHLGNVIQPRTPMRYGQKWMIPENPEVSCSNYMH